MGFHKLEALGDDGARSGLCIGNRESGFSRGSGFTGLIRPVLPFSLLACLGCDQGVIAAHPLGCCGGPRAGS